MSRLTLLLPLVVAMFWASTPLAATVVLVHPVNPWPGLAEASVRIHGELVAAGFKSEVVDGPDGVDAESRDWLEQLATRRGAVAVVALIGNKSPDSVEVWVVDKVTGKSVVRRVSFQPLAAKAPETLAIQAIELLRASFVEIDLSTSARLGGAKAAPAVVQFVEGARTSDRLGRFVVEMGGAAAMGVNGIGAAIMPMAGGGWAVRPRFLAQVSVAGMGSRASVRATDSSAQVSQAFALLGAAYRFRAGKPLQPFIALSGGALHTSVEGQADWPLQGRHASQWSFLLDGGLGASLSLRYRFFASLAVHAQMAEPYPAIRFEGLVVAKVARPTILLTLAVGAWL